MSVIKLFDDPDPPKSRARFLAAFGSAVLHASAATALVGLALGTSPATQPTRHFRVELLQLKTSISWPQRPAFRFIPMPRTQATAEAHHSAPLARNKAPQTLIVPDAPPELKLPNPIPAPFALSWLAINPATGGLPLPVGAAGPPLPTTGILSLPDDPPIAVRVLLVPKVSQSPEGSNLNGAGTDNQQAATEPHLGEKEKLTRLELPPGGKFPASVLGPSISEQYPDIATGLSGKIVSTVYLKVGVGKSWTLECWASGAAPLDPPWAYEIYRPDNLQLPPETEAILIGGTINSSGQFENLQLLLPPEWPRKDTLLQALQQWKFRPAARDGEPIAVKVLLVIPRQSEE
jgi:hypothetical protein